MTTNIWFNHQGRKYYARLALQNGEAKVLEGKSVEAEFVEKAARDAHRKITSWGYLPEAECDELEGAHERTKTASAGTR